MTARRPAPDPGVNPHPEGSPEHAEWAGIAHAPAWHGRDVATRRAALADAVERRGAPAVDALEVAEHAQLARRLAAAGVITGPDVSQYNPTNWATVKASGALIKFWKETEGRTFADPTAAGNRTPVTGMVEGCYHFLFYSDEYANNPALWGAQADWFAKNARPDVGHVLDVEAAATTGHWLGVKEWVAEYRKLFPGHPLGCYANKSLWRGRSRMPYDPAGLFDYIWHAGIGDGYYTPATGSIPAEWAAVPSLSNSFAAIGYPTVKLWQITDHAQVPGVSGTCDGNVFQGSAGDLSAMLTGKGIDDMAQADVDAITKYIEARVPALVDAVLHDRLANPWVVASGYGTAVTTQDGKISPLGMIYQNFLQLRPVLGQAAAIQAAVADDPSTQQIVDALVAQLGSQLGGGLTRQDLQDALVAALARVHVTVDPSAPAPQAGA